jgi:hypothetical protein
VNGPAPERVAELLARERRRFAESHPASRELHERAERSLLDGVPMNWMTRWPGEFPVFIREAEGATLVDVDGNRYADLCLGDTGAMSGHSPPATVAAIAERAARGITTMLPSEDAVAVGEEMTRRFRLPSWQFALSATDATGSRSGSRGRSRDGRGSWSSTTATTARSTRPSPPSVTAPSSPGRATSGRRCRWGRQLAWSSSTTRRGSSASSVPATSPACSPSRR